MVRSSDKRTKVSYLGENYQASKARTSCLLGLLITTLYYKPNENGDHPLAPRLWALATEHRRFGHPRLFALLKRPISDLNHKRSRRIYQKLKFQIGRRKRKKLGSSPRLPATQALEPNQIWAIDFIVESFKSKVRDECLNEARPFFLSRMREKKSTAGNRHLPDLLFVKTCLKLGFNESTHSSHWKEKFFPLFKLRKAHIPLLA